MDIIRTLFNMSITGSVIFLIFSCIKPLTKRFFNSSWHYKMLLVILIFFIIPIAGFIEAPIMLTPNTSGIEIQESENQASFIAPNEREDKSIAGGEDIKELIANDVINTEANIESPGTIERVNNISPDIEFNIYQYKDIIKYIWIAGMIVLFSIKIIPYLRFKSTIKKNSIEVTDEATLEILNQCKDELNIKKHISLKTFDTIASPMLIGILNPMVLIPNIDNNDKRSKMIFLHELNHYKRKDIITKALGLTINAIHWFNPIIYILLKEIDKYCEYSIDEKVVDGMNIEERKFYGNTILISIDNSMVRKRALTTTMGSSGKELKSRLENMLYFFKTTRRRYILSLLISVLIISSGLIVACNIVPTDAAEGNKSYVVYIKEDGLYYSYLDGDSETKIHDGNSFEYPLISKSGSFIAYTKDNNLYIYDMKNAKYEKMADEIEHYYASYDWVDDNTIAYGSNEKSGFTILNVLSNEKTEHIDEYYYTGLMSSKDNLVYGRKVSKWTTAEGDFMANDGIVEIDLNNYDESKKQFSTNIIVEGRRTTDEMIGSNPIVWEISADGRYVYIMEKPASGSLSSDGIGLGIYDVKEKTHTKFADIETLSYKNHLAINSSTGMIGLIEGVGRDMFENKNVVLVNINKDKSHDIINVTNEDFVAMTPSFTLDGKKLLYSATEAVDPNNISDYNQIYNEWEKQAYSIYEYDLDSSEIRKKTEGNDFDFLPMDISNDEILFIRYKGKDDYSLIKLVDGKENLVADNIMFSGGKDNQAFGFYGHIDTEKGMDVFISKNNKYDKEDDIDTVKMDELYKLKETYIGDNSNVASIINLLDFPEELTCSGIELFTNMELFTKEEHFGLQINFQASDVIIAKYISTSSDYTWRPQSLILFSLIDNLEYIQYGINSNDAKITASYINRQVADSLTISTLGKNISEVSASKKLFKEFYTIYGDKNNIKANQPEGLVGHIVIEDNTLHFSEVEIVEWDDQERVKELGLNQFDFPNGYTIIDKNNGEISFDLTDETIYTFTDVNLLFVEDSDSNRLYTTTKKDEFLKYLGGLNDTPLSEQNLPYFIEVKDGKVISITEKFKYTI